MTASCQYDTFCCMSKKRRTMKEKLASSARKQTQSPATYSLSSVLKTSVPLVEKNNPVIIKSANNNYSYVTLDARNTFFITSLLLVVNIFLAVLLQNRIIKLPFLGF